MWMTRATDIDTEGQWMNKGQKKTSHEDYKE